MWLGVTDSAVEGSWQWEDGTPAFGTGEFTKWAGRPTTTTTTTTTTIKMHGQQMSVQMLLLQLLFCTVSKCLFKRYSYNYYYNNNYYYYYN